MPHREGEAAVRPPGRGARAGVPDWVRAAIEEALFEEWADEAEEELAAYHVACFARLLARKAQKGVRAVRATISREDLNRGDFRRARRRMVDERPDAKVRDDFLLPAAALFDRMLRDGAAEEMMA